MPTIVRLARTERLRVAVLSLAMAVWFALIMIVVRGSSDEVAGQVEAFSGPLTKGFGLGALIGPDVIIAQLTGVSFNHPIVLALVGGVTVALGSRSCQGELERGTLDVTLAGPVSRRGYLAGYAVVMLVSVVVLMAVAWASMVGFDRLFSVPGTLHPGRAAMTCVNAGAVFATFAGIATLVSVLLGTRGSAMFTTIGILVVMFAVTFAERIWSGDVIQAVAPISVFHWFDPGATLLGRDVRVRDVLVPLVETVACFGLAGWWFERRDL